MLFMKGCDLNTQHSWASLSSLPPSNLPFFMRLFSEFKKRFLTHCCTNTNSISGERDAWKCWWKNFSVFQGRGPTAKMSCSSTQEATCMVTTSHSCAAVLSCETRRPLQWFSKEAIHLLKVRGQGAHAPSVDVNWLSEQERGRISSCCFESCENKL